MRQSFLAESTPATSRETSSTGNWKVIPNTTINNTIRLM